jgi:AraC family transcriptional regulator, positive regulator of tynA and feaB
MEVAMPRESSGNIPGPPHLDFETWKELVRTIGGRFNPEGIEPTAFTGRLRPISVGGLTAAVVASNAHRVERTQRDVRLDGANHYFAMFHVTGQSAMTHNEEAVRFDAGDVVLVDAARPVTFFNSNASLSWKSVALLLPRQSLVSHLGFEPRGGLCRHSGTVAGRLLLDLILNSGDAEGSSSPADSYMRLAVYDLVGALFAPDDSAPSRHADKLFMRVRGVIKDGFADPDFGPCEAAARAGISLRYLQKLFTQRGSTCHEFIYSFRLEHAARLLQRRASLRASLGASLALGEIAYACGFRDYRHFARKFRHRFGHAPGACSAEESRAREGTVNYSGQESLS